MRTENLTKVYRDRIVVDGVEFSIRGGEIFGLFGPNGSGKSTILRMLTGITRPNRGTVRIRVNRHAISVVSDPLAVREHASILTETPALYEGMELYDYLHFYGRLSRIPEDALSQRVLEAVSIVGMEDHLYRPLRQMSMGERQRVEIARVFLKDSPIIFLDEPFNGIDITTRREIRDYLKHVWLNENRCIFFTSHNLLESEHFVDRFAFIYQGKIIASGGEDELKKRFATTKFIIHFRDRPSSHEAFAILVSGGVLQEGEVVGNRIFLTLAATEHLDIVIQSLVGNGISFQEIHPVGTIEDIFIELVEKKKQREGLDEPMDESGSEPEPISVGSPEDQEEEAADPEGRDPEEMGDGHDDWKDPLGESEPEAEPEPTPEQELEPGPVDGTEREVVR